MPALATSTPTGNPHKHTYQAAAAGQQRGLAVVQGANDFTVATCSAANATILGVQEESTLFAGNPVSVLMDRECIAVAGGAIPAGSWVITNAAGQFVVSATAGDNVAGKALSSAAASGDEFVLFIQPFIR